MITRQNRREEGDPSVNEQALEHLPYLRRVSCALVSNRADAEDVVQDTYVRAGRASGRFQHGTNLKAWLLTILKNVIRNHRRDQRRANTHLDRQANLSALHEHLLASEGTPEQALVDQSVAPQLQKALESLPKALRDAVWLRDVEDMTYAEMAERLRIPPGTVMSRISRGRQLLRHRLEDTSSRGPSSPSEEPSS